jgi:hypothetical protein
MAHRRPQAVPLRPDRVSKLLICQPGMERFDLRCLLLDGLLGSAERLAGIWMSFLAHVKLTVPMSSIVTDIKSQAGSRF